MNRRTAAAGCQIAAPLVFLAATAVYPPGSDAAAMAAAHPSRWAVAVLLEAASGVLAVPGAVGVAAALRDRGRTLGLLGAAGAVLSLVFLAAAVPVNLVAVALARTVPAAGATRVLAELHALPALQVLLGCYFLGTLGGLLLLAGAARGRLVGWWVPLVALAGTVAVGAVDSAGPLETGLQLLVTVPAVAVGVGLLRSPVARATAPDAAPRTAPLAA